MKSRKISDKSGACKQNCEHRLVLFHTLLLRFPVLKFDSNGNKFKRGGVKVEFKAEK